jgi:hypothetical protein
MRTLKYAFIGSVLLFVFVAIKVPSRAAHPPTQILELVISVVAVFNVGLGMAARPFLIRMARANSGRAQAGPSLSQWSSANIVSLAMIESCALFAVVLHTLGSSTKLVGILFGAALLALFVWTPGTPPVSDDAGGRPGN